MILLYFFSPIEITMWFFLHSVNVMYYTDWFSCVDSHLHSGDDHIWF